MKMMQAMLEMRLEEIEAAICTLQDTEDSDEIAPWELVRQQIIIELNAQELN